MITLILILAVLFFVMGTVFHLDTLDSSATKCWSISLVLCIIGIVMMLVQK